jgi:hypothetical protein
MRPLATTLAIQTIYLVIWVNVAVADVYCLSFNFESCG